MLCPFCGYEKTKVIITHKESNGQIVRRRVCPNCKKRFNSIERPFLGIPLIIKNDGTREEYDREKLLRGIRISCAKRPVPAEKIEELVDGIEKNCRWKEKKKSLPVLLEIW